MLTKAAVIEALESLAGERDAQFAAREQLRLQARQSAAQGNLEEARQLLERLAREAPSDASAWCDLAAHDLGRGNTNEARASVLHALRLTPHSARPHLLYGAIRAALPQAGDAEYLAATAAQGDSLAGALDLARHEVHGDDALCCVNFSNLHAASGDLVSARAACECATSLNPRHPLAWSNLACLQEFRGEPVERARGFAAHCERRFAAAIPLLETALATAAADAELYLALADCYRRTGDPGRAAEICRAGIGVCGDREPLHAELAANLARAGDTRRGADSAASSLQRIPASLLLKFRSRLSLPPVYRDLQEVHQARCDFAAGLDSITAGLRLDSSQAISQALFALENWTNFYLPYQVENDCALLAQYGRMATSIMHAAFPQWSAPRAARRGGDRVRVGFVSHYFRTHSVANTTVGWLQGHDRKLLQVFTYNLGPVHDAMSAEFERHSDRYLHLPFASLESIARRMYEDHLDVLIYPDVGMAPRSTMLAALRLAPVQCASWGHPVTTGLPAVDYFLSGDRMEPACAAQHYCERLLRLPNLGVAYPWPGRVSRPRPRADFGLPDDALIYLSCQSLPKYHPRFDHVYPAIATEQPSARFVFLADDQPAVTEMFRGRLAGEFARAGLDAERHCIFLPQQHYLSYLSLIGAADVFLDTPGWSGANTAFEAVAMGTPLATMRGDFMRGCHCSAILEMAGMPECIAGSADEFVSLAVRLGRDRDWRRHLRATLLARKDPVFADQSSVRAFAKFCVEALRPAPAAASGWTS